jgi:hypothetical protein
MITSGKTKGEGAFSLTRHSSVILICEYCAAEVRHWCSDGHNTLALFNCPMCLAGTLADLGKLPQRPGVGEPLASPFR